MKKIGSYTAAADTGIRLNANESSRNLSDEILEEITEALQTLEYNRYPDWEQKELLEAYGKVIRLSPECLLAGNGSDQMLGYIIGTYLGKGKTMVTTDPDFSMYDYYASIYETEVVKYTQRPEGGFTAEDLLKTADECNAQLILFANPDNPTGYFMEIEEIETLVQKAGKKIVVVDEAYMEFAGKESAVSLLGRYPNLYVTRTLSKAYGLAGIRVGFLCGNAESMKSLKKNSVPYTLNCVSMKIAAIVLAHAQEYDRQIKETVEERDALYAFAKDLKHVTIYPSKGNFLRGRCVRKEDLIRKFEEADIRIRNYSDDTFRITIGTKEENQLVKEVLQAFEEEE